jgi:hypothetical protein
LNEKNGNRILCGCSWLVSTMMFQLVFPARFQREPRQGMLLLGKYYPALLRVLYILTAIRITYFYTRRGMVCKMVFMMAASGDL